ncbi:beta-glucosidase [Paraoerskovia marina]|uniref:Beta-glucosidase n=1 Tax=Paraoerskovia marina TaxID=545619 RepID=A0A1H1QD20_9CELL|nr:glycoside hydrolase family 3 protein [Paraoerskovia marina]SDS21330.1 beta-glucosidase [Paraoerskovia marina]
MATRREIKSEAVARVDAERAARRERKAELEAMTPEDRKVAKAEDKQRAKDAEKAAKAERKERRSTMTRGERREDKRRERVYRKVSHRPRRAVGWGVTGVAVVAIGALAAPWVSDLTRLTSMEFDTETAEGVAARENAAVVSENVADEGIVLLKNEDAVLPLAEPRINVFSFESFNLRLGGGGSGGSNLSTAPTLYEAMDQVGVEYNSELYATMEDAGAESVSGSSNGFVQIVGSLVGGDESAEPEPDYLTDDVLAQAQEFSDTAMIVVGNDGVEGSDMTAEQLRLVDNQIALLDVVTEHFDDVVVVVNSGNQMELGFLDEYPQIKSALWIGTPGPQGAVSLAKVLNGDVNPSGHLTDTYAYDVTSAPSTETFGDFTYDNADRGFLNYNEGIYVGYRYYETRYVDDEAGYDAAVQYPFGHGLSYTDFTWDAADPVVTDEEISVDVDVTNDGDVAGKDVVQVYFSAPYTPGGIEKSAIELAGYAKTSMLEPGDSETVTVTFDTRDMASWDSENGGGYLLEAGDYVISVSNDVHDAVAEFTTEVGEDVRYDTDADTGESLENRFEYAEGDLTYLSRDDWEGTYPDADDMDFTASDEVLERMDPTIEPAEGEAPTTGADNGLMFADLEGLDYDDPAWDLFLDQLTLDEQIQIFSQGAYLTAEVERLGVPSAVLLDSPAGLNSLFSSIEAASYPTEIVIASTWNDDLAYAVGESVGTEANAYDVQGWYAPGMNLHRSAFGGRDFEYYSEDPVISGQMAAGMVNGAQDQGVLTFIKHFALNDQEVNARTGLNVFVDEQAFREVYLQPFEIAVKDSDPTGAMSSFINIGGSWAGGNEQLLQEVLRGEWGFDGVVSTDAVLGGWMDPALAVRNGNDLMLAPFAHTTIDATEEAYDEDPVGVGEGLRDRVHTALYAVLSTSATD